MRVTFLSYMVVFDEKYKTVNQSPINSLMATGFSYKVIFKPIINYKLTNNAIKFLQT